MQKNKRTHRLGLKLWSINTDYYYDEAIKLYQDDVFDYIELYVVPNSLHTLDKWAKSNIPFSLHAPHFMHEVNLANKDKFEYNKNIFLEVEEFRKSLKANYTVIHAGASGNIEETISQLILISPQNAYIENKPYKAPFNLKNVCRGATYEEITLIKEKTKLGFCLDIGHCICSANSLRIDPYEYLAKLQSLSPQCYHISGNYIDSEIDKHLHLHEGNFDYKRIFSIIDTTKDIAVETDKDSKISLDDFKMDVQWLRKML